MVVMWHVLQPFSYHDTVLLFLYIVMSPFQLVHSVYLCIIATFSISFLTFCVTLLPICQFFFSVSVLKENFVLRKTLQLLWLKFMITKSWHPMQKKKRFQNYLMLTKWHALLIIILSIEKLHAMYTMLQMNGFVFFLNWKVPSFNFENIRTEVTLLPFSCSCFSV